MFIKEFDTIDSIERLCGKKNITFALNKGAGSVPTAGARAAPTMIEGR